MQTNQSRLPFVPLLLSRLKFRNASSSTRFCNTDHANTPVAIAEPKKPKAKPPTDGGQGDKDQPQDARAGAPPPVVAVKIKAKRKK